MAEGRGGGWSVASVAWVSLVTVALGALGALGLLSYRAAWDALVAGLEDHLASEAAVVALAVGDLPVETLALVGGDRSAGVVQARLDGLAEAAGLSAVALCGPDGVVLGGGWLAGRAERDLIDRARGGSRAVGPLYRSVDGALYMTAYHPLPGHPGWAAAIEGSGATLSAVDDLARSQILTSLLVLLLVALAASLVAWLLSAPLVRLDRQLAELAEGRPARLEARGPREVRRVVGTLQRLLDELEARDAELAREHEERVEGLTRLAAGIAHEIRNPLNAMSLSTQRLRRLTTEHGPVVDRLTQQLDQVEVIVKRLVDLTAPIDPTVAAVSVRPLVEDVSAEVGVEAVLDGDLEVRANGVMLHQVLRNLFLNARQAGASRVTVRCAVGRDEARLEVSDDGPGIPAEEAGLVFVWFHTRRAQGTGIGLPESRRLVEAMGGGLTLRDPATATFLLRLPLP
ncbi:MAG: HAMP domain-containing histidine kinase [Alphaproteobacteria bacterium]|nr:HAMP domain-containing histidine kinase [Alphaproteobacteria bacterium]